MNQITTTRPSRTNRHEENVSVLHFKRFLEAFSAPVAGGPANGMQHNAKFRVLHVKRTLVVPAVPALALVGRTQAANLGGHAG